MPKERHLHNSLPAIPSMSHLIPAPCTRPRSSYTPRNMFEVAALRTPSSLKLPDNFFPTDAEIDIELDAIDAMLGKQTERSRSKAYKALRRERYHQRWNDLFQKAGRDTMVVWGLKPHTGDKVEIIPVPNSTLSIRLWDNGLDVPGECCLDFISSKTRRAVNSESWQLLPASKFGALPFPLRSREEVAGYTKNMIPLGEERFDIKRGCCYAIRRPGFPDFLFDAPVKPTPGAAQPIESRAVGNA
ncbi:hypothetical protein F5050DRAFT_1730989 [Lentinula boryana]|uniref:Uncharacterized protein n=1 Tax=Lentinula boryana TaxID=40481 RepID=A0ABQ8QPN3_9AGAR|nr:hypothetical protein F5050DRAFT_1730989 [Lentinula boryana]